MDQTHCKDRVLSSHEPRASSHRLTCARARAGGHTVVAADAARGQPRGFAQLVAMQRLAGNRAMQRLVRPVAPRELDDPRWKDDTRFKAAFKNSPPIRPSDRKLVVAKLQQALVDAHYPMKRTMRAGTPDGLWGSETMETVANFQAENEVRPVGGWEVGHKTLGKLDELLAGEAATSRRSGSASLAPIAQAPRPVPEVTAAAVMEAGDVVVRAGTFSGKNPLVSIIGEPYNHGGVALDSGRIHHVEESGYETTPVDVFFSAENAHGGAVIRFQGPYGGEIRRRVADIAGAGRYVKIPGNPFSTADDLRTVNCNEFIHELYRQAIAELTAEAHGQDPDKFDQLVKEYGDPKHAGQTKQLIQPKTVEFATGGMTTGPAIKIGETLAGQTVDKAAKERGEVKIEFEGTIETRNLYPREWAASWNPLKAYLYQEGFYTVAVIRTFTPDSWTNSPYYFLVARVPWKR